MLVRDRHVRGGPVGWRQRGEGGWGLGVGLAAVVLAWGTGWAQSGGEPAYVLRTSGAGALVTASQDLDMAGQGEPLIRFAFGFATEEEMAPSVLMDSFTVSLQDPGSPGRVGYYLTVDGGGLQLAPATPGGVPVDSGAMRLTVAPFPEGLTGLPYRQAWELVAAVPETLQQARLTVHFDLFDNGDSRASLAWASEVGAVPEPGVVWLMLLGLGAGGAMGWWRRERGSRE